ncbi:MAG: FtsW/RodA/SpoVE family cell cycle protein, partial [Planctomycetaceae bacterium]|nr:FtsW/RodA/SpoVE family cell cycle protein [Planctomycetaceae bacterium]
MSYAAQHPRSLWLVPVLALALMGASLSAMARGDELAGSGAYAQKQAVWVVLTVPAMLAATLVSYRRLKAWSYPLYAVCLVLLVAVYFFPAKNYSHRWIPLGVADFQPSELAKLAYILTLAQYLRHRSNYRRLLGLLLPFVITAVPVVLILREPDLGTSLLFFPVLYAMLFAAGARLRHLTAIGLLGVAMLPVLWSVMSAEQRSRITAVFMQEDGGNAPSGDGYHLH